VADCGCFYFEPDHRLPRKYGLGAAALRYAALGFCVIPLARGGKRPHQLLGGVGGVHLASKDPDQIMDWWSYDMAANIGVATGSVNQLVVVDLDVKGGKDGPNEFAHFLYGPPPAPWPDWAPLATTPSGGRHVYLRMAGEVPERPGILPGVDVKGDGGLVVAPPSAALAAPLIRPGEPRGAAEVPVPYAWASGCPHAVPDAPRWMSTWLASSPSVPHAESHGNAASGAPLDDVLDRYVKNGVPRSMRNREVYRVACGLYRRNGTDTAGSSQVMQTIRMIYDNTDKTDFSWHEVLVCCESARRFVERSRTAEDARNAEFLSWLERRHR
jgi:hypothetical protein